MTFATHFQMMARYNRIANERLYGACAQLDDLEYFAERKGSFGSIHGLLNHLLLGDRIWMSRFEGGGLSTPALNSILGGSIVELKELRAAEDARIEAFFARVGDEFFGRSFPYVNNRGKQYVEEAPVAVAHFFNHQTHHRGQVHVMLSQTEVLALSLDLHRIINP